MEDGAGGEEKGWGLAGPPVPTAVAQALRPLESQVPGPRARRQPLGSTGRPRGPAVTQRPKRGDSSSADPVRPARLPLSGFRCGGGPAPARAPRTRPAGLREAALGSRRRSGPRAAARVTLRSPPRSPFPGSRSGADRCRQSNAFPAPFFVVRPLWSAFPAGGAPRPARAWHTCSQSVPNARAGLAVLGAGPGGLQLLLPASPAESPAAAAGCSGVRDAEGEAGGVPGHFPELGEGEVAARRTVSGVRIQAGCQRSGQRDRAAS